MKDNPVKVALVTESLWKMGGANRVLEAFCEMYPNADIYALFGDEKNLSETIQKHNIKYSFLNKIPFVKKIYRYTYFLWPIAIESFDLSSYDLVISSSSSVAHGCITGVNTKHICYLHSQMRYAWDMKDVYFNRKNFGFLKRLVIPIFLNYLRTWDVIASQRSDVLISNSEFVKNRCLKYWDREVDFVLNPPVELYTGEIKEKRKEYFVAGAPFEPNKGGEFLLECAKELDFNLKLIGGGSLLKKFKRKYSGCPNIEFVGWVDEKEKWKVLSNSKGFIMPGVEDFGIFPVEAMSCGTPVLAFKKGGVLESVKDGVTGVFFDEQTIRSFEKGLDIFEGMGWKRGGIVENSKRFSKEKFQKAYIKML